LSVRYNKGKPDRGGENVKEDEKMLKALEADMEACRKEYGDAPKLSDEEIERILKDIRKQTRRAEQKEMAP